MTNASTKITAIVVDDEPHARQALQKLLAAHPHIEVVAECENGKAAVKAVNDLQPQLMFLDIHMPKLDGFEVLELLGDTAPITVFITAHDDYAIQAFDKNALDYLLKPVSKDRLSQTIERIGLRLNAQLSTEAYKTQQKNLSDSLASSTAASATSPLQRILVRDKGDVFVIACKDVIAIEAADDYVVIHTEQQSHIKQDRLANFETRLDPQQYCRVHRSTLINLDYLQGIETEGKETRFAQMKMGGDKIKAFAISRSGYSKLIEML